MSEPPVPYKDNLTHMDFPHLEPIVRTGMLSDQEISETTELWPSVVHCPLAVSYATKLVTANASDDIKYGASYCARPPAP